jgi:hypothetical protein
MSQTSFDNPHVDSTSTRLLEVNEMSPSSIENEYQELEEPANDEVEIIVVDEDGNVIADADLNDENYEYEEIETDLL